MYHLWRTFAAKLPIARGMLGAELRRRKVSTLIILFHFSVISASTSRRRIEPSLREL